MSAMDVSKSTRRRNTRRLHWLCLSHHESQDRAEVHRQETSTV
jgi:hypothetical protein